MWDLYFYYLENICFPLPTVKMIEMIFMWGLYFFQMKHFLAFSSYKSQIEIIVFCTSTKLFLLSNVCVCVEDKLQIALIFSLPFNFSAVSAADCFSPPREQETYKTYKIQPWELPLQITSCQNSSPQ